jgi:hypothetical protein
MKKIVTICALCLAFSCAKKPTEPAHTNIYDLANIEYIHPRIVSEITVPYQFGYRMTDTLVFLFNYNGNISVYNIQDPKAPSLIKTKTINYGMALCVNNTNMYIADQPGILRVYSLVDTMPIIDSLEQWQIDRMVIHDHYIFAANANINYGLDVYDIQDPTNVQLVSQTWGSYYFFYIQFEADTMYMNQGNEIRCMNISNPASIQLVVDYVARSNILDFVKSGSTMYTLEQQNSVPFIPGGLVRYRIENGALVELMRDQQYSGGKDIAMAAPYLFVLDDYDIHVLSVADGDNPREVGRYPISGASSIKVSGRYIYAIRGEQGNVQIIKY